jgi:carboxylesterase type B
MLQFWTFENVRFGKAPLGDLRYNYPMSPDPIPNNRTLQNSTFGPSCINVNPLLNCTPGGNLGAQPVPADCKPAPQGEFSEDCLFVDVYVPGSVYRDGTRNLPVVVWIYGGAYVIGSKNEYSSANVPLYNATGVLRAAFSEADLGQFIYVAGNYRLGAFGWLAGNYMESQNRSRCAVTNAGIYD